VEGRKRWGKAWEGEYSANACIYIYIYIYICKWKLFQELGEERTKENGGRGELKYDIYEIL
jgi:hypothetical protein